MQNVEMHLNHGKLTIIVDIEKNFGPSKSGKTINIASTKGNVTVPGSNDTEHSPYECKIGLNVYRKP